MSARHVLITISRQFGSGGSHIGRHLAARLGYRYIDREILKRATDLLGGDEARLAEREERLSGFWESVMNAFAQGIPEAGYVPPPIRPVYDRDLFKAEAMVIKEVAEMGPAVIVGRCGAFVLKGYAGLVNTFIHARKDFRIRNVLETYHLADAREAAALIEESDTRRERFISAMTGKKWSDATNYHLCIDSGAAGYDAAEQMIAALAETIKGRLGL